MKKYLVGGLALLTIGGTAFAVEPADGKEKCCCCDEMKHDGTSCCPGETKNEHQGHDMHDMHDTPAPPAPQK